MMKSTIYLLSATILLHSCYTYKPDSYGVGNPDYNGKIGITNPHYHKRKTALGIAVMGLSIAGSGYGAYKLAPIEKQNGNETKKIDIANIGLGVLVGVGTNLLMDKAWKVNSTKNIDNSNFKMWVNKVNKDYIPLSGKYVLPKTAEDKYEVKNTTDVYTFKEAFPRSERFPNVMNQAAQNLNRTDLIEIADKYTDLSESNIVKREVLLKSTNVTEVLEAYNKYGDFGYEIEKLALSRVTDYQDAKAFSSFFTNTRRQKDVFINALKNVNENDYKNLVKYYKDYSKLSPAEIEQLEDYQKRNYVKLFLEDKDAKTYSNIIGYLKELKGISYPEKNIDFMDYYWVVSQNSSLSGNQILENLLALKNIANGQNEKYKVSDDNYTTYIKQKLDQIIKSQISVNNIELKKVNSEEDWKHWQNNFISDKIFQYEPSIDNVAAIYQCSITNNSKFDLPLKLIANVHFVANMKLSGFVGKGLNILKKLVDGKSFDEEAQNIEDLGTTSQAYYDNLPSGKTSKIIMPLRSSRSFNSAGISILGLYGGKYELITKSVDYVLTIADKDINSKLVAQQNNTIGNIIAGKYNSHLQGAFSGKKYSIEEEDKKWEQFVQSIKRQDEYMQSEADFRILDGKNIQIYKESPNDYLSLSIYDNRGGSVKNYSEYAFDKNGKRIKENHDNYKNIEMSGFSKEQLPVTLIVGFDLDNSGFLYSAPLEGKFCKILFYNTGNYKVDIQFLK